MWGAYLLIFVGLLLPIGVCFTDFISFFSAQPSPPTGLNHRFECNDPGNCTLQELANGSTLVTCICQSNDLILRWNNTSGKYDLQHYSVNISGNIKYVNTTFFMVRVLPERDYSVLVSTVSRCQQTSSAATIHNGTMRAGELCALVLAIPVTHLTSIVHFSIHTFAYVSTANCALEIGSALVESMHGTQRSCWVSPKQ